MDRVRNVNSHHFLEEGEDEDDGQEDIAAAEFAWGKEPVQVNQRWMKTLKEAYDFDISKSDKLFEFLVKEGRIKLPENHSMRRPDWVKTGKYCGFHDMITHNINDCRIFKQQIQRAIQQGLLKFNNNMKVDKEPFPAGMVAFDSCMVSASDPKGKAPMKVLTSERAKQSGSVDPSRQVSDVELQQHRVRFPNSRTEKGETSKPRVTSRILLNKWQRQQEKQYRRDQ